MRDTDALPILNHALEEASAFTAANLMESVRQSRKVPSGLGGHPKAAIEGHLKTGHRS
jgi:hypothetical protein